MTKALPFTVDSIARLIKGLEKAGKHVVGVRPDGIMILGDKPAGNVPLVPEVEPPSPPVRRLGERLNGGNREA